MIFNYTVVLYYILYAHVLGALNIFILFFTDIEIYFFHDLLFFNVVSFCLFVIFIYIIRHSIIKYNLNPLIKYGHLLTNKPVSILNKSDFIYVNCKFYHYVPFLQRNKYEGPYREFHEKELYADQITFVSNDQNIDLTREFKQINDYTLETITMEPTYAELLKKYDEWNLSKAISKSEIITIAKKKNINQHDTFQISLSYIKSGVHEQKDVIIGLDENYKLNTYDGKVYSNYRFEFGNLISILFSIIIIAFMTCLDGGCYFGYPLGFLFIKAIQYNVFPFFVIFLLFKRHFFRWQYDKST